MSNIQKQIASVQKLHGGERDQAAKLAAYMQWLARNEK